MSAASSSTGEPSNVLLDVQNLSVTFAPRRGLGTKRTSRVHAVSDVSFQVRRGETLALVGESGSGKSTIARAICGLAPYQGRISIEGRDLAPMAGRRRAEAAALRQMVFQDPYSSLDPAMNVGEIIVEPLTRVREISRTERRDIVAGLLDGVQLPRTFAGRLPHELSGGQRQRVAIARALSVEPPLMICDEALSALDVTTQAEVIDLLERLKSERGLSYLFIAHDLSVVRRIADRVAVMYFGRLVEEGDTAAVFRKPAHPYTQALLSAAPVPNPAVQRTRTRIVLQGELPDPTAPPAGCVFHPRCPKAMAVCAATVPARVIAPSGALTSCHLHDGATGAPVPAGA